MHIPTIKEDASKFLDFADLLGVFSIDDDSHTERYNNYNETHAQVIIDK